VRVKSVDGSILETHGSIETRIRADGLEIPYSFQLVSHQVDLKGDGILGRDFFKVMQAHICYKERLLTFQYKGSTVRKKLGPPQGIASETSQDRSVNRLAIPARTEMIARLPVNVEPRERGSSGKIRITHGSIFGRQLSQGGQWPRDTSVLNTREQEIEIPTPEVQLIELEDNDRDGVAVIGRARTG
jgi:hypothetical protein